MGRWLKVLDVFSLWLGTTGFTRSLARKLDPQTTKIWVVANFLMVGVLP